MRASRAEGGFEVMTTERDKALQELEALKQTTKTANTMSARRERDVS